MKFPIRITLYFIDLFAGAGGVTIGLRKAVYEGMTIAEVIAAINHDKNAIDTHAINNPGTRHFFEDIRNIKVSELKQLVDFVRRMDPYAYICVWMSAECTNHTNAKGGKEKDPDSRTLYHEIYEYIDVLKPDYIFNENVREIMKDGPVDENNRPIKALEGLYFEAWVERIKYEGYNYDWKLLNAADYGAHTSRTRYFSCFAKPGLPIVFPKQEYFKNPGVGQNKWRAVKEVLDFSDSGTSIFTRKKPLADKTHIRLYGGLIKHVAGGEEEFEKVKKSGGLRKSINSDNSYWLDKYYGSGQSQHQSINVPCGTITTKDRFALCKAEHFIHRAFSTGGGKSSSIDVPAGSILTNPKLDLVTVNDHKWISNPQWFNKGTGGSIEEPCCTIIARQDKAPLYLITAEHARVRICVYEDDSEIMVKIKEFMVLYDIVDIKMRMLKISELLRIQGFPEDYKMIGTVTDHKRFIGNSVPPVVPKKWIEAIYSALLETKYQQQTA